MSLMIVGVKSLSCKSYINNSRITQGPRLDSHVDICSDYTSDKTVHFMFYLFVWLSICSSKVHHFLRYFFYVTPLQLLSLIRESVME